jgi:apolipoprotein N-acyltransferase
MSAARRNRLLRARPFGLAAAAGALGCLGFVGFGIWPLALVFLAPLWRALEEAGPNCWRRAALLGFTAGWVGYAGAFHWMWRVIDVFLHGNFVVGVPLWLADSAWFASRFALYGLLYRLVRDRGWPLLMAAGPPLLLIEWLHPLLFPVHLGHALLGQITLIQICDLGGPLLLTALLVLVNLAVFDTWCRWRAECSRPMWSWTLAGLALVSTWIYGAIRIAHLDREIAAAPALRVGLVQGNLGVLEKGNEAAHDHRRYLEQTRELLAGGEVDLVVWPETVYTRGLLRPLPLSGQLVRGELTVPLLFGAASVSGETGQRLSYNSALLVGSDGVIRDAYDKNLLIPFTEYVPLAGRVGSILERVASPSHFAAATDVPPLRLGPWRISTPICYEVVRPAFVRRMVREADPHLIVTLANDSWFGESQEPWIHLALAKFRAVEHRRYLVRATNSGVSAVVDPAGRELVRSGVLARENLRATVHPLGGHTPYARRGDWPGWIAAGVLVVACLARRAGPA